jgi:serine/threonine protein kinase/Tfp pilus assembly protein PilF
MSHAEQTTQGPPESLLAALWPQDVPDDVRALLDANPQLRADRTAVLDLAFDEYCRLVEAGRAPDPEEYCARFPTFGHSLLQTLRAQEYLAANPSLLEEKKDTTPWPVPGETFLGFRLLRELGRGAFARVFLAAEPDLGDRLVAVKVSPRVDDEAKTLGQLNHPNVMKVHSVRKDERSGLTAVCMPYLGGATLHGVLASFRNAPPRQARVILDAARAALGPDRIDDGPAPHPLLEAASYAEGVCLVGAQLADALAFMHTRDFYHRDLKPSNVLLCPDGRPMLLDFNLSANPHARRERLGGTLPYMSPEQVSVTFDLDGAAPVDGRSDLFSLGVILFELLTGRPPFGEVPRGVPSAEDCADLLERQKAGAPPVRQLCPEATPALARVIDRCLAFERRRRPRDAAEVAAALRRDLTRHRRILRRVRRHPRKLGIAAALVLALAAGGIGYLAARPPYPERMLRDARAAYIGGDDEKALECAQRLLACAPQAAEGHFLRGRVYQRQGNLGLARLDYAEADSLGTDGRATAGLAYLLAGFEKHESAVTAGQRAVERGFATAEVYNNLAYSQMLSGHSKDANESLREALARGPGLAAAHHNRLVMLRRELLLNNSKRLPEVADALQKAFDSAPESGELHKDAAELCAVAGNYVPAWDDVALTHLERAAALGWTFPAAPANAYSRLRDHPRYKALPHEAQSPPPLATRRLSDPLAALPVGP